MVLGEIDGRMTPRVTAITTRGSASTIAPSSTPNIWGYLWGKEAYGAMLFATALTNESIADALAMPRYRTCTSRWRARSSRSLERAAWRRKRSTDSIRPRTCRRRPTTRPPRHSTPLVAHNRKSAKTHSGIWRDLAVRKRRTEVDAQLGIVVTLGNEAGVAAPLTARLVDLIHDVEDGRRPQSLETLDALAAANLATASNPDSPIRTDHGT